MSYTNTFMDKYNAVVGGIVALLTAVFGTYWYVFAAFLLLNVVDWITGWIKANKKKEESSKVGAIGAVKKLGYWAVILVAFLIASVFVHFGQDMLNINLSFLNLIGWWVLAMLIVNEARSILENLVELGYRVPVVLVRGLAVTEKLIEAGIDILGTNEESSEETEVQIGGIDKLKKNVAVMDDDMLVKFRNSFDADKMGFNGEEGAAE